MKSDDKSRLAIIAQAHNAEADSRTLRKKLRDSEIEMSAKDARILELERQVSELTIKLNEKIDELSGMMHKLVSYMMGTGDVSLSVTMQNSIASTLRQEYERQLSDQQQAYEKIITALQDELNRLRNSGDSNSSDGMSLQTRLEIAQQQVKNLRKELHGQKTEGKYDRGDKSAQSADEADVNGEDIPETECRVADKVIGDIAEGLVVANKKINDYRHKQKGVEKPRHEHAVDALANTVDVFPDNIPEDAIELQPEISMRYHWVKGYVRATRIVRHRYKLRDGKFLEGKGHRNPLGHTPADVSLVAMILYRHFIQHVTLSMIEEELREMGLNFAHSTIVNWMDIASRRLAPMDAPVAKAIKESGELHGDETTLKVCDVPVGKSKDESEEHYYTRWLYGFMSPSTHLVQYFFYGQGSRSREALKAFMEGIEHKTYLHSDGAKMYKCYDHTNPKDVEEFAEFVFRVACAVHVRRPFYKLKDSSEVAALIVDYFDELFKTEKRIKTETSDFEDRRRRRNIEIGPILLHIKNQLDILKRDLEKETDPDLLGAVNYALSEYPCLLRCLEDGRLEFSNNICEQQMRRIATYRNNSLFVGSVSSAVNFARINSYAQSCRLNGVDFFDWLCDVVKKLPIKIKDTLVEISDATVESLLPHVWKNPALTTIPVGQ